MRGLIRLIIILLAIVQSVFFWKIKKREPKKILIAHDLLLGDTLLLAPLMKRIHENYPFAEKFILSKPDSEILGRLLMSGFDKIISIEN